MVKKEKEDDDWVEVRNPSTSSSDFETIEGTDSGKPAVRATSPVPGKVGNKNSQDLSPIKESDVQHIRPSEEGWITVIASENISKDVL